MGAAPHPIHETLYMGLRPKPHSRTFLPKSPRDPKKPGRVRYILPNTDSKQGCRTAALLCVLSKHFKLYCQLAYHRRERREGAAVPAADGFGFSKLAKHFKHYRQLAELK